MLTTLQQEIENVLKEFPNYWDNDVLLKNVLIEDIRNYKPEILSALLKNPTIKKTYSLDINGLHIFKVEEFVSMLRYKNYLENSYTKYSNEIGLTSEGKYLKYNSDVVLDFPHKDGVLEGSMSKEDVGKEEIYYHNILAKDEIDLLFSQKVFTNVKKYDSYGQQSVNHFDDKDNLIIKGNNLIALHSLKYRYLGKIKMIYIDPPYNTGGDSFKYNDKFNHSTWLTFMKNRLEISKELLSVDGSIAISIDNNELGYLLVLLDEIFGRENRKNIITVKRGSVTGAKVINPGVVNIVDYVVIYSKDTKSWNPNRVYMSNHWDKRYNQFITNYEEEYSKWEFTTVLEAFAKKLNIQKSKLKTELGDNYEELLEEFVYENSDRIVQLATLDENSISQRAISLKKESLNSPNIIFFMEREEKKPYYILRGKLLLFISDRLVDIDGVETFSQPATDIWDDVLPNDLHNEGGVNLRKGKKPEKLISRIIDLCSNPGDVVLDFFAGSGTTAAVSLKKNRQFIVIEQLDYVEELTVKRILNSLEGEYSGISKEEDWHGGGNVVYAELNRLNQTIINKLLQAKSQSDIKSILQLIEVSPFLNIRVNLEKLFNQQENLFELAIEKQEELLIQVLDNNQLYLSYSEIDDDQYAIDDQTKAFNRSFYQEEV